MTTTSTAVVIVCLVLAAVLVLAALAWTIRKRGNEQHHAGVEDIRDEARGEVRGTLTERFNRANALGPAYSVSATNGTQGEPQPTSGSR